MHTALHRSFLRGLALLVCLWSSAAHAQWAQQRILLHAEAIAAQQGPWLMVVHGDPLGVGWELVEPRAEGKELVAVARRLHPQTVFDLFAQRPGDYSFCSFDRSCDLYYGLQDHFVLLLVLPDALAACTEGGTVRLPMRWVKRAAHWRLRKRYRD